MKLIAYAVYDRKALIFNRPFFMPNEATAVRAFINSCQPETDLAINPEDFVLMRVGSYDDNSGEMVGGSVDQVYTAIEAVRVLNNMKEVQENDQQAD